VTAGQPGCGRHDQVHVHAKTTLTVIFHRFDPAPVGKDGQDQPSGSSPVRLLADQTQVATKRNASKGIGWYNHTQDWRYKLRPPGSLQRFRKAAQEHLKWCDENDILMLGGRWDREDPITAILLAACADPTAAGTVISALLDETWEEVSVTDLWWPTTPVDILANFTVTGSKHFLVLEHKHVNSPENEPGYKSGRGGYWQTERMLHKIEDAVIGGRVEILGGPFDPKAQRHLIVLDARGRTMDQIFKPEPHNTQNNDWLVVSYADFASRLRAAYQADPKPGLVPLLSQLFAGWR
jgi:hypothetical protein